LAYRDALQNLPQIFSDLCYGAVDVVFKRRRRGMAPVARAALKIYAIYCLSTDAELISSWIAPRVSILAHHHYILITPANF
jgi:hypothetical protein